MLLYLPYSLGTALHMYEVQALGWISRNYKMSSAIIKTFDREPSVQHICSKQVLQKNTNTSKYQKQKYIYFVFVWILKLHSVFSHWTGIFARIFWMKMCFEIFPLKNPVWRNLQDLKDFRGIFNIVGSANQLEQSPEKVKGQAAGLNWSIDNICRGSTLIFKHWPHTVTLTFSYQVLQRKVGPCCHQTLSGYF